MNLAPLTKSIRLRLLLWLAFLFVCILTGFGVTAYQFQRITRLREIDDEFEQRVAALSADARKSLPLDSLPDAPPPAEDSGHRLPSEPGVPEVNPRGRTIHLSVETQRLIDEWDTNGFYFAFWSQDGDLLKKSVNAPAGLKLPEHLLPDTVFRVRARGDFREAFHFTEMGECALVGRNIAADLAAMHRFALLLAAVGAAVLALGLGGSGWLVSRALRPVEKISDAARRIAGGKLSERINVAETDSELGQLANTLNSTFARLDTAFARQRQFTAVAAHELRTPVSVMLTHTQNGMAGGCVNEEHREAFEACLRAAQRMRRLIETLLALSRLDAGQETVRRIPFDLSRTARDCVDLVRPLADERGVKMFTEFSPLEIFGDSERLAQVVTNLLANAIQYNKPNGEVRVKLERQNNLAELAVSDNGTGIPAEDLPRIFERFYRADKSRSTGGLGLGLAISKAIVEAHGGTIEVSSNVDAGTTFTVRLPVA
jgi:signal transduction histidine kinase